MFPAGDIQYSGCRQPDLQGALGGVGVAHGVTQDIGRHNSCHGSELLLAYRDWVRIQSRTHVTSVCKVLRGLGLADADTPATSGKASGPARARLHADDCRCCYISACGHHYQSARLHWAKPRA